VSAGTSFLTPDWPAPPNVHAAFSLRSGGVSAAPFDSLNLGTHVGDDPERVGENRRLIGAALALPAPPRWLAQVHGTHVLEADPAAPGRPETADAVVVRHPGAVAAIQVADCLPVLFAAADGRAVAAAHAGWRGLAAGVLEATLQTLGEPADGLLTWLGPAIGPEHFEVGDEVRAAFVQHDRDAARAFAANARGRWQCDLVQLARRRLQALGVRQVYGGHWCTFADPTRFFSYRREGRCGRMGAFIWRS
jgi:YfiH family protein